MNIIKFIVFSALNIVIGWTVAVGSAIHYADGAAYGKDEWARLFIAVGLIYIFVSPVIVYNTIFKRENIPSREKEKREKESSLLILILTFIVIYYLVAILSVISFSYIDIKGYSVDQEGGWGLIMNIIAVMTAAMATFLVFKRSRKSTGVVLNPASKNSIITKISGDTFFEENQSSGELIFYKKDGRIIFNSLDKQLRIATKDKPLEIPFSEIKSVILEVTVEKLPWIDRPEGESNLRKYFKIWLNTAHYNKYLLYEVFKSTHRENVWGELIEGVIVNIHNSIFKPRVEEGAREIFRNLRLFCQKQNIECDERSHNLDEY